MELYELWKPLMRDGTASFWQEFYVKFYQAFIEGSRWKQYLNGVGTTLLVTAMALTLGILLGIVVAVIRTAHDQQRTGHKNPILGLFNGICKVYVTVIRGTPMMVQLLIMGFVIFSFSRNYTMVGALTLGINSGAYVSEIIRGGLKDPRISPWTSVVAVEVAPDLKSCKAWISVLGDEEVRKSTLQGLKSAEGFIRRELARTINLRNTPDITFVMDQSIEYGVNMSHKIDEVIAADEAQKPDNEVVEDTEETEEGDE